MNKRFPEWYRIACISPNNQILEDRWKGIQGFLESEFESLDILELARMFFGIPASDKFVETFTEFFAEVDQAFPRKSGLELSVLAGTILNEVIETYEDYGDLALLAIQTIHFTGREPSVPDVLTRILAIFEDKCVNIRENIRGPVELISAIPDNDELLASLNLAKVGNPWGASQAEHFEDYIARLSSFLNEINEAYKKNMKLQQIQSEDSQILWWIMGQWSRDLSKPIDDIPETEASIIVGKELADLVQILPGPYSSNAIIHQALGNVKDKIATINVTDVIDSQSREWRNLVAETYPASELREITPLLTGVLKSLEVDGAKEWIPVYKRLVGLNPDDLRKPALDFAYQMYLECLLIKCIRNIEG